MFAIAQRRSLADITSAWKRLLFILSAAFFISVYHFAQPPISLGEVSSPQAAPSQGLIAVEAGRAKKWLLFVSDNWTTGTIYDLHSYDRASNTAYVVSHDGGAQPIKPQIGSYHSRFIQVWWNTESNLPVCVIDEHPFLKGINLIAHWVIFAGGGFIFLGFLLGCHILSAIGAGKRSRLRWIAATIVIWIFVSIIPGFYPRYQERCDSAVSLVNSHRSPDGAYLLPIPDQDAKISPFMRLEADASELSQGAMFLSFAIAPFLRLLGLRGLVSITSSFHIQPNGMCAGGPESPRKLMCQSSRTALARGTSKTLRQNSYQGIRCAVSVIWRTSSAPSEKQRRKRCGTSEQYDPMRRIHNRKTGGLLKGKSNERE